MLVLTQRLRDEGEEVLIETPLGNVIVSLVAVIGTNKVRLGFSAPKEIRIHRREVYERKQKEAAGDSGGI